MRGGGWTAVGALPLAFAFAAACTDSTAPRPVGAVRAVPDSAHLSPGESVTFDVLVLDERGDELPPEWKSRVAWSVSDPTVARLDTLAEGVTVTALTEGSVTLRAELSAARRTVPIWVRPAWLDSLAVEPDPIVVSSNGGRIVRVRVHDQDGAERPTNGLRISWEILDTMMAYVPWTYGADYQMRVGGQADLGPLSLSGTTRLRTIVNGLRVLTDVIVTAEPVGPLEAPEVAALSATSLEIGWERDFAADRGYRVHRSLSADGPFEHVASPGAGDPVWASTYTTHVDTGLSPATTYHYYVVACNEHGCSVVPSPVASGTTAGG